MNIMEILLNYIQNIILYFTEGNFYRKYNCTIANNIELTEEQKRVIEEIKFVLKINLIPLDKIRFVFNSEFEYDVDRNVVNPRYSIYTPRPNIFGKTNYPMMTLNKPYNLKKAIVPFFRIDEKFVFLRELIRRSKRGIVMCLIASEAYAGNFATDKSLHCCNLDDII